MAGRNKNKQLKYNMISNLTETILFPEDILGTMERTTVPSFWSYKVQQGSRVSKHTDLQVPLLGLQYLDSELGDSGVGGVDLFYKVSVSSHKNGDASQV